MGKKPTTAKDRLEQKLKKGQDDKIKEIEENNLALSVVRKDEGNALFTAGNNLGALAKFSEAIELDPKNHVSDCF